MPATRTIAFATVLGLLTIGAATGCASAFNRLEDGVVRDEPVTEVTISGGSGDITVQPDATVKGIDIRRSVRYLDQAPSTGDTIQFVGGVVTLKTNCGPRCSASYEVRTPTKGVKVRGGNGSGNLVLQGVSDVDVEVGSGDVTINGASGSVRAQTGSGNIKLTDIAGPATISTGSGDVTGGDLRGTRTAIEVSSGNVDIDVPGTGDLTVVTGSGDVDVRVPERTCRFTVHTDSGDQTVEVAPDPASPHVIDLRARSGNVTVRSSLASDGSTDGS